MSRETIGIVGFGQMGRGIAQVAASKGFPVKIHDSSEESLKKGITLIDKQLQRGVQKGRWDDEHVRKSMERLRGVSTLEEMTDCKIVIEAATEKKEIKADIFSQLDRVLPEDAILASNTSSISITFLGSRTRRPDRVAGMHFMNPVPVMKLVEGIRGLETSDETFGKIRELAVEMDKTFIQVQDVAGFAINRILMPTINEAVYALYEGIADKEDIDTGMKLGAHWPMGPLELADFIGLDTCLSIMEVLHEGLGDGKYRPCPLLRNYVLAGRLGRKSGRGFYSYED